MTRTMYDSVTLGDIPANATMVAGYTDGRYANIKAVRQKWPHALHVSITVTGNDLDAQVVDCEQGDTTPAGAAAWAKKKHARSEHPTIYCSLSVWDAAKRAVSLVGLKPSDVSWWIASYDNRPVIPPGAVAKQYSSSTHPNLDTSVVVDYWPGVDAPPKPPAKKVAPSTRPKPVAKVQPAPKHPAPHPAGPSTRQRARAALLAKLHLLHLLRRRR